MSGSIRLAVAGLGTVGVGVLRLVTRNKELLRARSGKGFEVIGVSARNRGKDRGVPLDGYAWFDDPVEMARTTDADVFVELIGGADGPALAACEAALDAGRHVVTANKALLAEHGTELAARAEKAGVALNYEAAVAGGIPIVKALREGLAANRIEQVVGILNGTCNYILTTMRESGRDFEDVLSEAQAMGYAEADPGFDIDGIDAAHKLAILTSLAFGTKVDFASVSIDGIRHVSPLDLAFAAELGFRIKLLAIARETERGIEQRVHPCMVPVESSISHVEGVYNAVMVAGDFSDDTVYEGQGAGEGPTASAVVADVIDIARGKVPPVFGVPASALTEARPADMSRHVGPYYVRLMVRDQPGVIADISAALRDESVSLEAMIQRARAPDEAVPVVLTTHETVEASMQKALERIAALDTVLEPPRMIRIEQF